MSDLAKLLLVVHHASETFSEQGHLDVASAIAALGGAIAVLAADSPDPEATIDAAISGLYEARRLYAEKRTPPSGARAST